MFWKAVWAILALICGGFTVANGYSVATEPSVMDGVATAGFGAGSVFFGWLANFQVLLSKIPALAGLLSGTGELPKELSEAIAAIYAFSKAPKDWAAQKNAIVQCLEAAFAIGQAVVKDPALDQILANAKQFVVDHFDANAPKTISGEIKSGFTVKDLVKA